MIAIFAIRSLLSPTMSYFNKTLIIVGIVTMMSTVLLLQQSGYGPQSIFSSTTLGMTAINGGQQGGDEDITQRGQKVIKAVTWNIAAVNNNPFEYWITNEDLNYNKIMSAVSAYIDSPGDMDIPVNEVFTDEMFDELADLMTAANITGVSETRIIWKSEYRERKVISQFIKDSSLGKKRLISMPDRVTNTINTVGGSVMRPSVINCYNSGDLGSTRKWWFQWKKFMFKKKVSIKKRKSQKSRILKRAVFFPQRI